MWTAPSRAVPSAPTATDDLIMPFDPVRDAVLNSPQQRQRSLPSPRADHVLTTPMQHVSSPSSSSYFNVTIPGPSTAPMQSPSTARRATDLAVLLNEDNRVPSPSHHRRWSISSASADSRSPVSNSGTPRPRSSHLSRILQFSADEGASSSSISSPVDTPDGQTQASPSRFTALADPSEAEEEPPPPPPALHLPPNLARRPSSTASAATQSSLRSPPALASLSLSRTRSSPSYSFAFRQPLPSREPTMVEDHPTPRSQIPYAPRSRRTAPSSVLVPFSTKEREFYRTLAKNPLKSLVGITRRRDEIAKDTLLPEDRGDLPCKRFKTDSDVGLVVEHYNQRPEVGVDQRENSPIIGLKSFNNWVKSVLIARFAHPALHGETGEERKAAKFTSNGKFQFSGGGSGGRVLDLGCGKGGDLRKWQKARIREYVGVDIADVSIEQARARYSPKANSSKGSPRFSAFFAALDCYTTSLSKIPDIPLEPPFDVVSMQFCMHYAFESVQKARMMLENVTKWLKKGGRFIGTIPNHEFLLKRLDELPPDQDPQDLSFGNSVYRVKFDNRDRKLIFGQRYSFFLLDAVKDVPEYVVHWDDFLLMAAEYRLRLLYRASFHDIYAEHCESPEYKQLLERMKVVDSRGNSQMDAEQWEAANVYIGFAFEKD